MTHIKSPQEIQIMTHGGKLLREIRNQLIAHVKPGAVPLEIDKLAQKLIKDVGGTPSFMSVHDYRWATCISVNDGVVHGVPTKTPFKSGDRVGLDVGLLYKGFHTDTSWSVFLPSQDESLNKKVSHFLRVGEEALEKATLAARVGNRIGHISQAIQSIIEAAGFSVVRSLVGHGVGKTLHESPQVPGVLTRPLEKTPKLVSGMVLAIEAIYTMGKPEIVYKNEDGWTLASADGSISGLFEHTVLVSEKGPIILT